MFQKWSPLWHLLCAERSARISGYKSTLISSEPKLSATGALLPGTTLPPKDKDGKPGLSRALLKLSLCEECCQPSANTTYSELWAWTNEGHNPCPDRLEAFQAARYAALQREWGRDPHCILKEPCDTPPPTKRYLSLDLSFSTCPEGTGGMGFAKGFLA